MIVLTKDGLSILNEQDVVIFRNRVLEHAKKIGMSILNQTKLITAGSELARNMLKYGGGGHLIIEVVNDVSLTGIRLIFEDKGPGIPDIELAMKDGYSTGRSLGLGLPGAKRLSNQFNIISSPGKGTKVTILRWKNGF
jgi:serine/threonine-protein kinase RsbT